MYISMRSLVLLYSGGSVLFFVRSRDLLGACLFHFCIIRNVNYDFEDRIWKNCLRYFYLYTFLCQVAISADNSSIVFTRMFIALLGKKGVRLYNYDSCQSKIQNKVSYNEKKLSHGHKLKKKERKIIFFPQLF